MLQFWHGLKLQVRQKQPSGGAWCAGHSAQSRIRGLLKVAEAQACTQICALDPDSEHTCLRESRFFPLAHFAAAAGVGNVSIVVTSFGSLRSSCRWES